MTTSDARTPASTTHESVGAGKSIGWHKGYVEGSRPGLRVPVRQVHLTNGKDVTLYDTSGPYTDPAVTTDVRRGLASVRGGWIEGRGDTEEYEGRPVRPEDDGRSPASRDGLRNLDALFPGGVRAPGAAATDAPSPSSLTPGGGGHPGDGVRRDPRERRPRGRT